MNIALDANALIYLLESTPGSNRRLRGQSLLQDSRDGTFDVVVPGPAWAEYLVGAKSDARGRALFLQRNIRRQDFDDKAIEELAIMLRHTLADAKRKTAAKANGWDRHKFDCMVIACAKAAQAETIVTGDSAGFFAAHCRDNGLKVLRFDELRIAENLQQSILALNTPKTTSKLSAVQPVKGISQNVQ